MSDNQFNKSLEEFQADTWKIAEFFSGKDFNYSTHVVVSFLIAASVQISNKLNIDLESFFEEHVIHIMKSNLQSVINKKREKKDVH